MIPGVSSLRAIGSLMVLTAFAAGGLAVWVWMQSNANWRHHQQQAYGAGVVLFGALQNETQPPEAVRITPLAPGDQALAVAGAFRQISGAPTAARVTIVPISADPQNPLSGKPLTLVILSPTITYGLADLIRRDGQTAAETMGELTRKLASLCSDPMVLAKTGDQPWVKIDGTAIWACDVAPADHRLLAALIAAVVGAALITATLNLSSDFAAFADQLRNRRRVGGPTSYDITGPQELRDIVAAVNSYLEVERDQLASRAAVLSGVSHDLGAPATRLKLRTALIPDLDLRKKLETDIDSMTAIIESVLTYTRIEMNAETPRKLSLTSLIEAIVFDYQDMGQPVKFRRSEDIIVQGGRSIFMSRQGHGVMPSHRDVIVSGRPVALGRAITNLIDNALKYGRRATVALETDARSATIVVQDEGSGSSASDIQSLMAPFKRGENTATIDGHGLGLTIVATIAELHGGALSFEDSDLGVAARLVIERG